MPRYGPPRGARYRLRIVAIAAATTLVSVVAIQPAEATAGTQQWVARLVGPSVTALNHVAGLAVSPDGSRLFVAGDMYDQTTGGKLRTVAYDDSGAQLWSSDGPRSYDLATGLRLSPDGSTVFVVGSSNDDYLTLAYDAATGARVWKKRYKDPIGGNFGNEAGSLGVSPDGSAVFVTGASDDGVWTDYATVAYKASTGHHLWTARYGRSAKDAARALSVSPDSSTVFVSGFSVSHTSLDIETIGYNAATGHELWKRRYDGPAHHEDQANAMAVSPDGSQVHVTGFSDGSNRRRDFVTLAYGAKTGTQRWIRRYNGAGDWDDNAKAISVSPDGSRIYVAGYRTGHHGFDRDAETIAYSSAGERRWHRAYNGPADGWDQAAALGVSPDGTQVYVTGFRYDLPYNRDYMTLAYRASTGEHLWEAFYDQSDEGASALGVNPDGSGVYVSGMSGADFTTVAYSTS
jgi:WD40 repeat protein